MKVKAVSKKAPSVLLGDLLVKSRLIEMKDLADAIPISMKTGLPVGRILIGSGAIKESTMQAVLIAQSLVRDRLLTEQLACVAIQTADNNNCSLDDALKKLGWKSESYELTNRLGELFLEAGVITNEQLESALEAFISTGLPLARVLVLQGTISAQLAFTALTAQKLVRDQEVTREQATDALWLAHHNNTSLEESLNYHGYVGPEPVNAIRLGELLVLANIINEIDLLEGVERSINHNQLIGETMVQDGTIPQYLLDAAVELQRLTTIGEMEPAAAGEVLRRIYATGMTVEEALLELSASQDLRSELLGLQNYFAETSTEKDAELKGLMSVELAAEKLGLTTKAVTKRIKKGVLSGIKKNGRWFVRFSDEPYEEVNFAATDNGSAINEAFTIEKESPTELSADAELSADPELRAEAEVGFRAETEAEFDSPSESDSIPRSADNESSLSFAPEKSEQAEIIDNRQFEREFSELINEFAANETRIHVAVSGDDEASVNNVDSSSAPIEDRQTSCDLPSRLVEESDIHSAQQSKGQASPKRKPKRMREFVQRVPNTRNKARSSTSPSMLAASIPPELSELLEKHLELIEKLSQRVEQLSYKAGFLEGRLSAQIAESRVEFEDPESELNYRISS